MNCSIAIWIAYAAGIVVGTFSALAITLPHW